MYCKDCVFRQVNCNTRESVCLSPYLTDDAYDQDFDRTKGLKYSYDEGGWFEVGDYFGCVHFKDKNIILKDNPNYSFCGN